MEAVTIEKLDLLKRKAQEPPADKIYVDRDEATTAINAYNRMVRSGYAPSGKCLVATDEYKHLKEVESLHNEWKQERNRLSHPHYQYVQHYTWSFYFLNLIAAILCLIGISFGLYMLWHSFDSDEEPADQQQTTETPTPVITSQTITVNGVDFTMISVEGGTFKMGATPEQGRDASNDEHPAHLVTLSSFYIGETEVTQAQWQVVMGSNPSGFRNADNPVEKVSWDECQTFIRKLNNLTGEHFRLPTEAEWEFAARGGNASRSNKYSGSNTLDDVAWHNGNGSSLTWKVKSKAPNELGLYDMSGNVGEWCQDRYAKYDASAQTNPTGPATGNKRVNRGGSWTSPAWGCRVSRRNYCTPTYKQNYLGLRLAL